MELSQKYFVRALIVATLACVAFFGATLMVRADEGGETPPPPPVEEVVAPPEQGESGENGENGATDPQPPVDPEPAVIETGDAVAGANTEDTANNTETTSLSGDLTASTTNDAIVDNDSEASASTGGNAASGDAGALIDTGDAVAFANVVNVVNTNIINSTGLVAFLNYIFGDGFDLRALGLDYFLNPAGGGSECSLSGCNQGDVTLNSTNSATVTNDVIVRADTGGNQADGGDGVAIIETGNAYAAANLINVVNTSLVGSNYLLVVGNNFGSLAGDITLPGVDFFNSLFANSGGAQGPLNVNTVNDATVTDNVTAEAGTGGNTADGGGSLIVTGNAVAGGTSVNQVNTNEIGGTSFMFLINVVGNWTGSVHGLPDGIEWARTPNGVALMSAGGDLSALTSGCCSGGSTTVNATNTASVTNNVGVYALTGDNQAGAEGGSLVDTGNAYAAANSVNIVNTNILGRNWIFAIFNIFGDWTGNVSFGHPDLWVGAAVEAGNPTRPGTPVEYCFTVSNTGDADAHNVLLTPDFSPILLSFAAGQIEMGGREGWLVGDIARGTSREMCYEGLTGDMAPGRSVAVPLTITATADETEQDMADNSDIVTIIVESFLGEMFTGAGKGSSTGDPHITMKKTASVSTTTLPASIDYTIVVTNSGGAAYRTTLTDTLKDPEGYTVFSKAWDLKTIYPNEELTLTYTVDFKGSLPVGLYKNTAVITGQKGNHVSQYAVDLAPITVTSVVELTKGEPQVLGVQAMGPSCAEYITTYIRPGAQNDRTQVKRLQYFFRDFEQVQGIAVDGVYGPATIAAVNAFQAKYESDVLGPWGMKKPSGYVYYTTRKKINDIYCQGITEFPLKDNQQEEIVAFKSSWFPNYAGAPKPKAPEAVEVYVKPSVLEIEVPKATSNAVDAGANSFFDRLFMWGKSALAIPEVNAQVK